MGASLDRWRLRADNVSGFASMQSDDIQSEYHSIKDSVVGQKLPKDLKFAGSTKGIKNQSKDVAKCLMTSGKYLETCLKLVSQAQCARGV